MKEKALTGGGLSSHELFREKSAEAIVDTDTSRRTEPYKAKAGSLTKYRRAER